MSLVEPGQDPNNFNTDAPAETPELSVDLANPGQANTYLNPQIPTSDTILPPQQPPQYAAPTAQPQPTSEPLQASIPPTAPAEAPKPQIAWDRVAMVGAGVIVIVALGAYLLFGNRASSPKTPATNTPTTTQPVTKDLQVQNLSQHSSDGKSTISSGGSYNAGKLTLEFDIANASGTDVIPEVEVQPMGTAFTNAVTAKGQAATSATPTDTTSTTSTTTDTSTTTTGTLHASVVVEGLADGAYHWQARATQAGKSGDWASYGSDVSAADFTIDTVAPGAPTVASIDSVSVVSGQTVKTTSNRPTFTGKADPNSTVNIDVQPEGITLAANTDSAGNWSLTASSDVPNGNHTLTITSADTAGNTAASSVALGINTATAASPAAAATTPTATLAPTGQSTSSITLIALVIMVLSFSSLLAINRYGRD